MDIKQAPEKGPKMDEPLTIAPNGLTQLIGPADPETWALYESLVADDFARTHPGDSFENLKHRARFAKEDKGLLRDWLAVAAMRAGET